MKAHRRLSVGMLLLGLVVPLASSVAQDGPQEEHGIGGTSENGWSLALDASFNSKYVWRGMNLVDDPVFQPSLSLSYRGLNAYVWANQEMTDINGNPNDVTEVDFGVEYSWAREKMSFLVGAVLYDFPNTHVTNTMELYLAVEYATVLSPTLTIYRDVEEADGTYVALSAGHTFEEVWTPSETACMSVDLAASVAYGDANHNDFYFGHDSPGFVDATISARLSFTFSEGWSVSPSLNYSVLLDRDNRSGHHKDHNVWAGLSVSFSF